MTGRRILDQAPKNAENGEPQDLKRRARYLEKVIGHFRNRWRKEYLTGLREYHRQKIGKQERIVKVNDMVHIQEEKIPRQRWRMGKVIKLLTGKDGNIRAAEVLTHDKSQRVITMQRPLQKLYPLEVSYSVDKKEQTNTPAITMVHDEDVQELFIKD